MYGEQIVIPVALRKEILAGHFGGMKSDSYSKWPCLVALQHRVQSLRWTDSDFGTPEELKADNGPQFSSVVFMTFWSNRGVHTSRHMKSRALSVKRVG